MGATLWSYTVEYQDSVVNAFRSLQEDIVSQEGGGTLKEYVDAAGSEGTSSILDMERLLDAPAPGTAAFDELVANAGDGPIVINGKVLPGFVETIGTIFRMSEDELEDCFGDARPSREMVEAFVAADDTDFEFIGLYSGRYAVLYTDDRPSGLWFVGWSRD